VCAIIFLQFRNVRHTLLVMIAVPFSFIGIAIALLTHGQPLSYLALFGGVGLVGVVVNDSIVMTDYLNGMRSKMSRRTALKYILEGAATRMRPIMVTSITTVAGLLPTAYGFGGRDQMVIPCTLVMSWGLFISTNLTLLIVPSMYYIEFMGSLKAKRETEASDTSSK
jgi:multidrug efflux pump subunit AcrB